MVTKQNANTSKEASTAKRATKLKARSYGKKAASFLLTLMMVTSLCFSSGLTALAEGVNDTAPDQSADAQTNEGTEATAADGGVEQEQAAQEQAGADDVTASEEAVQAPIVPMSEGSIVPQAGESLSVTVKDDNGTIDLSGTADSATWTYSGTSSNVYDTTITVGLPTSATGSVVTVTLAPGVAYSDDGSTNTQLAAFLSGAIGKTPDTTGATYGYTNADTGTRVYSIKDGTAAVTIPIRIKADEPYRLSTIANAITVNLTSGSADMTQVLETVNDTPQYQSISYYSTSKSWLAGTDTVYEMRAFETAEMSKVYADSFHNGPSYTTYSNALAQQVKMTITLDDPAAKVTSANSSWTCTDLGGGVFEMVRTNFNGARIRVPWAIEFPSADFSEGDTVTASCVTTETYFDGTTASANSTRTFTIAPDEYAFVGFKSPSDAYQSGAHSLDVNFTTTLEPSQGEVTANLNMSVKAGNAGSKDSTPKTCEILMGDTNISVKQVSIPLPKGNTLSSVYVQANGGAWVQKAVNITGGDFGTAALSFVDLGLNYSDSITGIRYDIGVLPANYIGSGALAGSVNNTPSQETCSIELYDVGTAHANSTGVGTTIVNAVEPKDKAALRLTAFDASETLTAGGTFHISGTIEANDNGTGIHTVENPIIYLRSEADPSLTFSNWSVTNSMGQDLTSQVAITNFVDAAGKTVYMIDTRGITDGSAELCQSKVNPVTGERFNSTLTVSYDIVTPQNQPEGTYQYKDMWFAQAPGRTGTATNSNYYSGGDPYSLADASGVEGLVIGLGNEGSTTYYKINPKADIIVSNQAKGINMPDWTTWDQTEGGYIQVGTSGTFNFRINVLNNAGVSGGKDSIIYQPIMKAGEDWGELNAGKAADGSDVATFPWSAKLTGPITNPDPAKYKISYGVGVTPSDDYDTIDGQTAKFSDTPGDWSTVNCIRIELIADIADKTSSNFDMTLGIDDAGQEGSVDIVKPIFFRDVTNSAGQRYAGASEGDPIAMQTALGKIQGTVWDDTNHNGVKDSGEPVIDGTGDGGWSAQLFKTTSPAVAVQTVPVKADGTYTFPDVSRAEGYYIIKIENLKDGESYFFTKVGSGDLDNKFADSADHALGTCTGASGALTPGTKGEGDNSVGIYNVGITKEKTAISFDSNRTGVNVTWGTITPAKVVSDSDYAYEALTAPTDPSAYGYTFEGWATSASATADDVVTLPATFGYDNLTYYGVWTADDFTVTYAAGANGTVTGGPEDVAYNGNPIMTGVSATPSTGYKFDTWNYTMDNNGTAVTGSVADPKTVTILGDATFTAQFKAIVYTIDATDIAMTSSAAVALFGSSTTSMDLAAATYQDAKATTDGVATTNIGQTMNDADWAAVQAGTPGVYQVCYSNNDDVSGSPITVLSAEHTATSGTSKKVTVTITDDGEFENGDYKVAAQDAALSSTAAKLAFGSSTDTMDLGAPAYNNATAETKTGGVWAPTTNISNSVAAADWTAIKAGTEGNYPVTYINDDDATGDTKVIALLTVGKDIPRGEYKIDATSVNLTPSAAQLAFESSTDSKDLMGAPYNNVVAQTFDGATWNPAAAVSQVIDPADWAAIQAGTPGIYLVTYTNDDDSTGSTKKTVSVVIDDTGILESSLTAHDFEYASGTSSPEITDAIARELADAAGKDDAGNVITADKIIPDATQLAALNTAKDAGLVGSYPLTFVNSVTGEVTHIVVTLTGEPNIAVDKVADVEMAKSGDTVTYTITATNTTEILAQGVWVKDYVPANTTFVSCDAAGSHGSNDGREYVSWFADVEPMSSVSYTLTVTVNEVPDGTGIENIALYEITGGTVEPTDPGDDPVGGTSALAAFTVGDATVYAKTSKLAKTGDDMSLTVIILGLASLTCAAGALGLRRRRQY